MEEDATHAHNEDALNHLDTGPSPGYLQLPIFNNILREAVDIESERTMFCTSWNTDYTVVR